MCVSFYERANERKEQTKDMMSNTPTIHQHPSHPHPTSSSEKDLVDAVVSTFLAAQQQRKQQVQEQQQEAAADANDDDAVSRGMDILRRAADLLTVSAQQKQKQQKHQDLDKTTMKKDNVKSKSPPIIPQGPFAVATRVQVVPRSYDVDPTSTSACPPTTTTATLCGATTIVHDGHHQEMIPYMLLLQQGSPRLDSSSTNSNSMYGSVAPTTTTTTTGTTAGAATVVSDTSESSSSSSSSSSAAAAPQQQALSPLLSTTSPSSCGVGVQQAATSTTASHHQGSASSMSATPPATSLMNVTFPQKLMMVLNTKSYMNVISWLPCGTGFVILRPNLFLEHLVPRYFGQDGNSNTFSPTKQGQQGKYKFASFTRKLNRWYVSYLLLAFLRFVLFISPLLHELVCDLTDVL